jgi:hypothetical protein
VATPPDEVLIITDEGCDPCATIKQALANMPLVRFVDLASEEADAVLGDVDRIVVPMAVARFGEERRVCDLAQDGETVYLLCGEDLVPLKE